MKNFFKELFCRHDYKYINRYDDDPTILFGCHCIYYQCTKCGKQKPMLWSK